MNDTMVVARMSKEKKDAVARKLTELGTNASGVINLLYDYIEQTGKLPFENAAPAHQPREERVAVALAWLKELQPLPEGNRFQEATDEDIRFARLENLYN